MNQYYGANIIADQSAFQSTQDFIQNQSVDILGFFSRQNLSVNTTPISIKEMCRGQYRRDIFSQFAESQILDNKNSTYPAIIQEQEKEVASDASCLDYNYVISTDTGSLSFSFFDPNGYPVICTEVEPPKQAILWETSVPFKRMTREACKKNNYSDIDNIRLTRKMRDDGASYFLYTNDKDQVKQCDLEGLNHLAPIDMLHWMQTESFISRQKAVSVFSKWGMDTSSRGWQMNLSFYKDCNNTFEQNLYPFVSKTYV